MVDHPLRLGGVLPLQLDVLEVELLQLIDLGDDSMETYPFECWLLGVYRVALLDQANGLKHIGDIVQPPDLGLKLLLLLVLALFFGRLTEGDLLGRLIQSDDTLPSDE